MASPDDLWAAYAKARETAEQAWGKVHEVHLAGGTTSQAGLLFSAAYQAQQAADIAYQAWLTAQAAAFPGARG